MIERKSRVPNKVPLTTCVVRKVVEIFTLSSAAVPLCAPLMLVTFGHFGNLMHRFLARNLPITIEFEVRYISRGKHVYISRKFWLLLNLAIKLQIRLFRLVGRSQGDRIAADRL